ncbi:MAG: hypothetical protein ACYCPF_17025 [Streptosporangiaceae bacterium]
MYSRYAGAMLLHAYGSHASAGEILAAAAGDRGGDGFRYAGVALLSSASICFALGAATVEQFSAACAGPLAGLAVLPALHKRSPYVRSPEPSSCAPIGRLSRWIR